MIMRWMILARKVMNIPFNNVLKNISLKKRNKKRNTLIIIIKMIISKGLIDLYKILANLDQLKQKLFNLLLVNNSLKKKKNK